MLVPEVEQLRGEDGRREEAQEEKATYGQVLHILPRKAAGEGEPPKPMSMLGNGGSEDCRQVGHEKVKRELDQAILVCQGGFCRGGGDGELSFSIWKMK